jgi:hypothetical protein
MKLRSFFYLLASGTVLLLLIAVGGFFWLTSSTPLQLLRGGALNQPNAAIFVPKQAPIMASLLVNPDRLEAFRQLVARPVNRRRSRVELNKLENSLLAKNNIDYQRDIRPWVGDEITWAVTSLDFDHNPKNSIQPGYLLAVSTKDPEGAREFLQLFYSKQATAGTTDLVFETYKGVNLTYVRPTTQLEASPVDSNSIPTPETLTSAIVGDRFVLFANHPKVLRDAINNVQVANLSLEEDEEYQQKLQSLTEPKIALSFLNLPAMAAWISKESKVTGDPLQGSETLAVSLSLNRKGLLGQSALLRTGASKESIEPTLSKPVDALKYIPANSALTVAGSDLNQLWQRLSTGVANDETLKPLLEKSIASWESRWDIKLPQEIFSWVQGEYALSLLPRPDNTDPDWVFVAEKIPGANTDAAINHLDDLAKKRGFSVGNLPLGEYTISAWTKLVTSSTPVTGKKKSRIKLEAQVSGVHATVGNYEILTSSIEAMSQALAGLDNSLLKSDKFQEAIAPLPQQNDGYVYIDWQKGETYIERQLPILQVVELVGKPLFNHLQSVTISSYGVDQGVQRSKLFFRLGNEQDA